MGHRLGPRVAAAVAGILVTAAAAAAFVNSSPPVTSNRGDRLFVVEKGESLARIAERLADEGYIRSTSFLRLVARLRGTGGQFKAGWYRVPSGSSTLRVHDLLVSGSQSLVKLTIPEGWTVSRIAALVEERGIATAADFETAAHSAAIAGELSVPAKTLEGFLFPDTYFVPSPFPAEMLIRIMVETFFDRLDAIEPGWRSLGAAQLFEKVTLASIVEREYQVAEEAPLIASVFANRLRLGIGLESCATIAYIITEIQHQPHPEYITLEDKGIDSPYNTYKWAGLPPGPIANPGRVALDAAFHPARTDYLYFVLRDPKEGRHYFSRDLDTHNKAKKLYLKK
jgi:UPF0755 protein